MNTNWSVLVLYEGASARDPAVAFCDTLVQRFWPRTTFELEWLDWATLRETSSANRAHLTAKEADMFVMATAPLGKIDPHVKAWLELALRNRGEREGILVGLSTVAGLTNESAATQQYLRKLAHRNGLDYFTSVPASLSRGIPETAEAYQLRATQVTSVLDTILHRMPTRRML